MNFTIDDAEKLLKIIKARRDVRGNRFVSTPIEDEKLKMILEAGISAPSVGYSQPWKFVLIKDAQTKESISQNFSDENEKAKEIFKDKALYKELKLEGIKEAPINIAVLYEPKEEDVSTLLSVLYKICGLWQEP